MKQLTWWRGVWRVWIIGTVAWAVWMFWKSDPQCLIDLVRGTPDWATGPWCEYRNFEYYAWLLASMFGWPVLTAILMLASRWAIAGFSEPTKAKLR
jgi:hypothetical protein